ncbi:MAG: TRAP transporter large permease [Oscillospiraceae bacterium]
MNSAVILFGLFVVLLLCNVSIAVSLGVSALVSCMVSVFSVSSLPVNAYAATHKYSLLAIPFFILAGNVMEKAGISEKLIELCRTCVGHLRSGLAIVCVITCCFFAAISGSGPATVAALGVILIPAMVAAGYRPSFAAALMASGGAIGVIIPPSVTFIVYGCISGASVASLFMAGFLPGILMGLALVVCSLFMSKKQDIILLPKASRKERLIALKDAIWALMMPVIILGGIYGGIFTPTEAAAVSAVYGILVGAFVYKKMSLKELIKSVTSASGSTGQVMFVMISASMFAYMVQVNGLVTTIGRWLEAVSGGNVYVFLLICNLILLLAGMVMDAVSALYIFVPILLPVALQMGYNITAFGIMICVNLAIGLVTPPVGVNLYVGCSIAKVKMNDIIKDVFPMILALLAVLIIVTYIPGISMLLPNLLNG